MKRFAVFALTMLVALFPMIANAEDAAELPAEEIWSATARGDRLFARAHRGRKPGGGRDALPVG